MFFLNPNNMSNKCPSFLMYNNTCAKFTFVLNRPYGWNQLCKLVGIKCVREFGMFTILSSHLNTNKIMC